MTMQAFYDEPIGEVPGFTAAELAQGRRAREVLRAALRDGTASAAVARILRSRYADASTASIELARRFDELAESIRAGVPL